MLTSCDALRGMIGNVSQGTMYSALFPWTPNSQFSKICGNTSKNSVIIFLLPLGMKRTSRLS